MLRDLANCFLLVVIMCGVLVVLPLLGLWDLMTQEDK